MPSLICLLHKGQEYAGILSMQHKSMANFLILLLQETSCHGYYGW